MEISQRTTELIKIYISKHRPDPKPLFNKYLFINQRKTQFTRHGIYKLCKKYLSRTLDSKRLKELSPVHSFRHACAVNMLILGKDVTEIKNRLGHQEIQSTMVYLNLELTRKREIQKELIEYNKATVNNDEKLNQLVNWENKNKTLEWLDSL